MDRGTGKLAALIGCRIPSGDAKLLDHRRPFLEPGQVAGVRIFGGKRAVSPGADFEVGPLPDFGVAISVGIFGPLTNNRPLEDVSPDE